MGYGGRQGLGLRGQVKYNLSRTALYDPSMGAIRTLIWLQLEYKSSENWDIIYTEPRSSYRNTENMFISFEGVVWSDIGMYGEGYLV